jgi:hypothetical protein
VSAAPERRSLRYPASTGLPEPLLRRPWSGVSTCEEIEKGRVYLRLSVTQRNSVADSLWVFQNATVLCANLTPRARAGALSPVRGPTWACFNPLLFTFFLFLFLPDLGNP